VLAGAAGAAVTLIARPLPAAIVGGPRPDALVAAFGDREITASRVTLDMPALAENGNSVNVVVDVDSPMRDDDIVHRIAIFAPANPVPGLISFELTPLSGRAHVEARVRLADSQRVWAIAETGDGRLYGAVTEVTVTLAACLDTFG
jgi:sulfur-oxidizing protein SoxY